MVVRVQQDDFDLAQELQYLSAERSDIGAVVSFTGRVRDSQGSGLLALELEHYPGMTKSALDGIEAQALQRWPDIRCSIVHRYGTLKLGAQIMMVAVAAPHRGEAFAAAEFLMDYLKSRAPFWKKEITAEGDHWVAATTEDETALKRW